MESSWPQSFALEWTAAWNSHDLQVILSHYSDAIIFHSPRIRIVTGEDKDFVSGKSALAQYWRMALIAAPNLFFELDRVYQGSDSITLLYRNHHNQNAAETFRFDNQRLVVESFATYA